MLIILSDLTKGKIIVIEGLDGSGKATQSDILLKKLSGVRDNVKKISFPAYHSDSSMLVRMYLNGEVGSLSDVNVYAASSFYSADRYINYITDWKKDYDSGSIIIADRYTQSNAPHQMVKLPKGEWDTYLEWLYDYEFNKLCIPRADIVIYLDVHPTISKKLIESRYDGDESKKDLHESNFNYLLSCRDGALYSVDKLGWFIIKCNDENGMFSIEKISNMILDVLHNNIKL